MSATMRSTSSGRPSSNSCVAITVVGAALASAQHGVDGRGARAEFGERDVGNDEVNVGRHRKTDNARRADSATIERRREFVRQAVELAVGDLPTIGRDVCNNVANRCGVVADNLGEQHKSRFRAESDPVRQFVSDACSVEAEARITKASLYAAYSDWARHNGYATLNVVKFHRGVELSIPQPAGETRDGRGGPRMFVGLRLRSL